MLRLVFVVAEGTTGIPSINFPQCVWLSRMQVSFPFPLFFPNSNNSWTKWTAEIPEYPQKPGSVPPSPTPPRASFCSVSPSDVHHLSNEGAGSGGLVLPGGGKDTDGLVVTGKTVDTRLDKNQAELAIPVLAVALKVLAHGNGLLDKVWIEKLVKLVSIDDKTFWFWKTYATSPQECWEQGLKKKKITLSAK